MKNLKKFFSQKFFWIGLLSLIGVVCIFMIGILGSSVNPKPTDLPVALVIEDEGIKGATNPLNFGETIKQSLTNNSEIPFDWTVLQDKDTAISQMNNMSHYATIVIPENTSTKIASLSQPSPQQPEIEIIINEGLNYRGSNATSQIIDQIVINMNNKVRNLIYQQSKAKELTLPPEAIQKIVNPLKVNKQIINDVGKNSANGNAPVMFTQILWLSVFISTLIIFFNSRKNIITNRKWIPLINQLIAGILSLLIIVSTMLLFANYVLGVNIPNIWSTFLFLLFSGLVFFLLQNALINWIGLIASPFILLLFLFSIPVLTFPPEFLPDLTNLLLYSWIPLKFSVEGLRDIFYFGSNNTGDYMPILGYIGIGSFIIMILSIFIKQRKEQEENIPSTSTKSS